MLTIIGGAVAVLAAIAAYRTVERKNFHVAWGAGTLFFSPLYLFIFCRSAILKVDQSAGQVGLVACGACGQQISAAARTCPGCGHPNPLTVAPTTKPSPLEWVAAVAVSLLVALIAASAFDDSLDFGQKVELPQCNSNQAKDSISKVMSESVQGKMLGLKIIKFNEIKTVYARDNEVRCTVSVTLNTAGDQTLDTKFFKEKGKVYVQYSAVAD